MLRDFDEEIWDIDWFGFDARGHVAHFASGGRGFLPTSVKASLTVGSMASLEDLYEMPVIGSYSLSGTVPSGWKFRPGTDQTKFFLWWEESAMRGLFGYDCLMLPHRPEGYFRVVIPSHPITIRDLPGSLGPRVAIGQFNGLFADSTRIDLDAIQ
jgi:hypothetical protein